MGLFNIEQNISSIPINMLLHELPVETLFVFGDSCVWIMETTKRETGENFSERRGFQTVCDYFPDIKSVMENFNNQFKHIMINPDLKETIPEQICDVMKSNLPKDSNLIITPTKQFIAFNNNLSFAFKNIYDGYNLRHKFGVKGFEIPPIDIGYMHVLFTCDGYYYNRSEIDLKIHWFYPLAMVRKDKS